MSYKDTHIFGTFSACFAIAAVALSSCRVDISNDLPATEKIKTFSEIVGLTSVNRINVLEGGRYSARRLPINIKPENYIMELSGEFESNRFCKKVFTKLEGSKNSVIGILQSKYNPEIAGFYDGQFLTFLDIPKTLEALDGLSYERLIWQNVEENIGEIFYKKTNPSRIHFPSGRSSGPSLRSSLTSLESFLSDLPDNYIGYPVFQLYKFENANYTLYRTMSKTPEQLSKLDQNYSPGGGFLPSNSAHQGSIDIYFNGGKLEGFGEDRSFAEFHGSGGVYYLHAVNGQKNLNILSGVSIHFFDPSIKPGERAYKYQEIWGSSENRKTSSHTHSGPVSHKPICNIRIRLKSPPKL